MGTGGLLEQACIEMLKLNDWEVLAQKKQELSMLAKEGWMNTCAFLIGRNGKGVESDHHGHDCRHQHKQRKLRVWTANTCVAMIELTLACLTCVRSPKRSPKVEGEALAACSNSHSSFMTAMLGP